MYIQMLVSSGDKIKEKYDSLTQEQRLELLNEIKQTKSDLEKQKLVCETKEKSLQERKTELEKELREKYKLGSIEEAQSRIAKLDDEIVSAIKDFAMTL